ncbi:MAG: hypothetical protein EOP47_27655 [Sphingobacteriaceae bacterium]|nr:MAG: hypothetical protein EOP47_27655 [Sphingobacteriaceae bacterium]
MKKAWLLFFLILSCVTGKAQKISLGLHLTKGATYHLQIASNLKTTQTINGNLLESELSTAVKVSFTVTGIRDSLYDMQVRYDSLNLTLDLPVGTIKASSESGANNIYAGILSKLKSQPFLVVMTKTGRIVSVNGLYTLITDAAKTFTNIPEEQRAQAMNQVLQSLGEKIFKSNIELCTRIFPPQPVSINDKWVIDSRHEAPVCVNVHALYLLKGITPSGIIIEGNCIIQTADNDARTQLIEMPVSYSLGGNMKLLIKADKTTGWIAEAKITRVIKGNMAIEDNPKLPGGMLIPVNITGDMVISNK